MNLTLDRVNRAVIECNNAIAEKSRLESEEIEARAAKRFRDVAAAGSCLICMDDNPNIATLCCGKAVHISCIVTWLSQKHECPHCRISLPSIARSPPVAQALPAAAAQVAQDTDSTQSDDPGQDTNTHIEEVPGERPGMETIDDTTSEIHSTTLSYDQPAPEAQDMEDNTSSVVGDTADTSRSTMSDTSTDEPSEPQRRHCTFGGCRNQAANNCSNETYGSCCQMYGHYSCHRHNT